MTEAKAHGPMGAARYAGLVFLAVAAILLLAPYLVALGAGQPDAALTGVAAMHSRANAIYCADGLTSTGQWLMAETVLVLALVVASLFWKPKNALLGTLLRNAPYLFVFLVLVSTPFIFAWQTDSSVCTRGRAFFWESIFIEVFILCILAISYNLLFGFTGLLSFGHSAFFGMGAYLFGTLILHLEMKWWVASLIALAVCMVIALIKGVVGLRVRGLYFALFTMALSGVLFLLAGNRILVDITGAEDGFTFQPPEFLNMTQNRLFIYYLTLLFFAFAYWLVHRLMQSPTGQVLRGLRDNDERARVLGFNTFNFKLIALMISGFLATSAGILRAIAFKGASPDLLSTIFTFDPLVATIIGGTGTFAGPVLGVFTLRFTEQLLRDSIITLGGLEINIGDRWPLILGVFFILIVIAFPQGLVGTLRNAWNRMRRGRGQ